MSDKRDPLRDPFKNAASNSVKQTFSGGKDAWLRDNDWGLCAHLKFWLDLIPLTATWYNDIQYEAPSGAFSQTIMRALPHNQNYASEMMLLDKYTNSMKEL